VLVGILNLQIKSYYKIKSIFRKDFKFCDKYGTLNFNQSLRFINFIFSLFTSFFITTFLASSLSTVLLLSKKNYLRIILSYCKYRCIVVLNMAPILDLTLSLEVNNSSLISHIFEVMT
jgi:hypothetical protein